jgi:tetratricopeptide (TPR) repeat protein
MSIQSAGPVPGGSRCRDGRRPEEILGVEPDADLAAVRRAYLALARRTHPDAAISAGRAARGGDHEDFVRVNEAYRTLVARAAARLREPACVTAAPADPDVTLPPAAPAASRRERVREAVATASRLVAERDTAGAVGVLHEVVSLAVETEKATVRRLLARAYLGHREWRRYGLALLQELVAEDPADAEALALLGALYHREGLLSRADATLRRALAVDPGHAEAQIHLRAVTEALKKRRDPVASPSRPGLLARLLSIAR